MKQEAGWRCGWVAADARQKQAAKLLVSLGVPATALGGRSPRDLYCTLPTKLDGRIGSTNNRQAIAVHSEDEI
jgi:hypothetical protein